MLRTEYGEPLNRILARVLRDGRWEGEVVQTARDARKIVVATRWALRRDEDGRPVAILEIGNDVTERRRQEQRIELDRQQLAALADELLLVEERQRRQIAAALHESIGQTLALARQDLSSLTGRAPEGLCESLREICEKIGYVGERTKNLIFELNPSTLHRVGLAAAVEELAEQFTDCEGFICRVQASDAPEVSEPMRSVVYRAVREVLVNVTRHAEARNVQITMERTGRKVRVTVVDDGRGFDPSCVGVRRQGDRGLGISSLRKRLAHIGGEFLIDSVQGRGTKIVLTAPLEPQQGTVGPA